MSSISGSPRSTCGITGSFFTPNTFDDKQQLTKYALKIIRSTLPLGTVFQLKYKIDLHLLTESQEFFLKTASFFIKYFDQGLSSKPDLNKQLLLSDSAFSRLFDVFKDLDISKDEFITLCMQSMDTDASEDNSSLLLRALQLRIFSFKNAVIAIKEPKKIAMSLEKNKLRVPDDEIIRQAGIQFIKISLFNCFQALLSGVQPESCQEELEMVAKALLPFVLEVASSYLTEKKYAHPENIFTFRNPTGYNSHGITACVVMEGALKSLGFNTRNLSRMDLDPRLNETAHAITLVEMGHDKFIVDTNYIPSIKNIRLCSNKTPLPVSTLLVLNAKKVDAFAGGWTLNQFLEF